KLIFGFLTLLLLVSTSVVQAYAWYDSTTPWSQNQHDSQHTGMGTSSAPSSNSTLWTYDSVGDARARHIFVDDGQVFAIRGGSFFVLDETTGAFIVSGTGGGGYGGNIGGAYADGRVYYTSYDYIYSRGTVYCFNATTGTQMWSFDTSPGQIQHPPTVSGNRVYVGTLNNYTYCIEDGVQKWYKKLGGPIYPAPAVDGDLLVVGCDDGKLYAFDVAGAQPVSLWNFTVGSAVRETATIQGNKVYCTSSNGYLYVLDRTNGHLIWSWKAQGNFQLAIAVAYGIVYVDVRAAGWGTYPLYALYANVTAGNYTYGSPEPRLWGDTTSVYGFIGLTVSGNTLFYCSTGNGVLYARNALTGTHLWSFKLDYGPTVPIVADGRVFVADQYRIYCIGASYPPVTNAYSLNVGGQVFSVTARTNSTLANIDTSDVTTTKNMSFTVESSRGTGMCNITLPNSLIGGPYVLTVGGQAPWTSSTTAVNATHSALYLTYNGTGKYVAQITGATAVPEFSLPIVIMVWGILTLTVVRMRKRRSML
ncbi:PQQ-binding-like beta-propeller repeat protein, partial [Candidatus Bathyarchaeota archaeon]|nr:PQQ-binding-like beta-propeller repeat protein [Candidatus Bathyarchaeota archaeon]